MSSEDYPPHSGPHPQGDPPPQSQEIRHSQVSALVPKNVARGVFTTGAVVLQGAHEFIIDFLLRMAMPHQVAARIVMTPAVLGRFIAALRENLGNYQRTFHPEQVPSGTPIDTTIKSMPRIVPEQIPGVTDIDTANVAPQSGPVAAAGSEAKPAGPAGQESMTLNQNAVQDLYDQLKMADEMLSGAYANAVMIGHTASEFSFDFITTFFPRSAVSARVYMSAGNVPRFLSSITHAFDQFQRKFGQHQPPPHPPQPPHPENDE
jgi:hypothetical protein